MRSTVALAICALLLPGCESGQGLDDDDVVAHGPERERDPIGEGAAFEGKARLVPTHATRRAAGEHDAERHGRMSGWSDEIQAWMPPSSSVTCSKPRSFIMRSAVPLRLPELQ